MYGRFLETPKRWGVVRRASGIYLVLMLTIGAVSSPTLLAIEYWVSTSGSDANSGTSSSDAFRTITHALDVAVSGDTINVLSGTYDDATETFPLMLESGVAVVGEDRDTTIVSAPAGDTAFYGSTALSGSTRVSTLTITHDSFFDPNDPNEYNLGILFDLDNVTQTPWIENNIFLGADADPFGPSFIGAAIGIRMTDTDGSNEVFTGLIENNTFTGPWDDGIFLNNGYRPYSYFEGFPAGPAAGGLGDNISPTISNNSFLGVNDAIDYELFDANDPESAYLEGSFSPVITGNAFRDQEGEALEIDIGNYSYLCCGYFSQSGGLALDFVFSNNTVRNADDDILEVDIDYLELAPNAVLTFNPMIMGNDIRDQTSGDVFDLDIDYLDMNGGGSATFSPMISNNTVIRFDDEGVEIGAEDLDLDSNDVFTFSPTIADNLFRDGDDDQGIEIDLDDVYSEGGELVSVLTITGNEIDTVDNEGIEIDFRYIEGSFDSTLLITSNTISEPDSEGIEIDFDYIFGPFDSTLLVAGNTISGMDDDDGIDIEGDYLDFDLFTWNIDNNRIDGAGGPFDGDDGIDFNLYDVDFDPSSPSVLSISGNRVTGSEGGTSADGISIDLEYLDFNGGNAGDLIRISGNELTGNEGDGINFDGYDVSGIDPGTVSVEIRNNFIDGNSARGLDYEAWSWDSDLVPLVGCNTFTSNGWAGIYLYEFSGAPAPDFGGGAAGSDGNNSIFDNGSDPNEPFDFYNDYELSTVMAELNWWNSTDASTIDSRISDDDEGTGSMVDFQPFLGSAVSDDVDVFLSQSISGNTITYTATIDADVPCGCAAVYFEMPIPTTTTVVEGSATTSQGIILSEDPLVVQVGEVPAGQTATITVQATFNPGKDVAVAQATATCNAETLLSDDPAVPGGGPTIAALSAIPTVEWYAMMLLAMILATVGIVMMRRRRGVVAGLVLFAVLAGFSATDAEAADRKAPKLAKDPVIQASAVHASLPDSDGRVVLTLSAGAAVSVEPGDIEIVDRRRGERGRRGADDDDLQAEVLWDGTLGANQPMLVEVRYDREGGVDDVRVTLFSSWEQATALLDRKMSRRDRVRATE